MPPNIAPGYHIFTRDPANDTVIQLGEVAKGNLIWWSDAATQGSQAAGGPPTLVS
jgi:hypothetical protein